MTNVEGLRQRKSYIHVSFGRSKNVRIRNKKDLSMLKIEEEKKVSCYRVITPARGSSTWLYPFRMS